jgi:hypothetical protein
MHHPPTHPRSFSRSSFALGATRIVLRRLRGTLEGRSMGTVGRNRREPYSSSGEPQANQRLSVRQAAARLGTSEGAVRSRIKRGTLRTEKLGDRVFVVLGADEPTDRTAELIATLREQLQAERKANEENRRIIAALTQRIPEIEAPEDDPGSPQPRPDRPGASETPAEAQEATEPRTWWRRMFGS